MTKFAIEVNKLGKKYQKGSEGYLTLRDKLTTGVKLLFRPKKKAEEFWALKDVSFAVKPGEVLGIIGRNGAGKSTLLKILARITEPTMGQAVMCGRVASMLEVGTGFNPELTGRENILLNGAILGMTRQEVLAKADEIIRFSGVSDFIDTQVKHYSSGMYTRLAFAVAAHLDADILLVDEVLSVGDIDFQKKCLSKIDEISHSGRTVIFVSHDLSAIKRLCTQAIYLKTGSISYIGDVQQAIKRYFHDLSYTNTSLKMTQISRQGNGNLQFTGIDFRQEGKKVTKIFNGKDLVIRIGYKLANKKYRTDHYLITAGIDNELDQRLTLLSSISTKSTLTNLKSTGHIDIIINRLPLTAGKYYLSLYCESKHMICDWLIKAVSFEVIGGHYFESGNEHSNQGNLLLEHKFEVRS